MRVDDVYPGMNIRTAAAPMTAVATQPRKTIDRPAVKAPPMRAHMDWIAAINGKASGIVHSMLSPN